MACNINAATVIISNYEAIGTHKGYPLYYITENSIEVKLNSGDFNSVYIDDVRVFFNGLYSPISSYTLNVSKYLDGNIHKLYLSYNGNSGTCYFTNTPPFETDGVGYVLNEDELTATIIGLTEDMTSITIPSTINVEGQNYSVTSIGGYAFRNCHNLASVTIGLGLLSIGSNIFYKAQPKKVIWLTNTPPSGYANASGAVNYVANEQYTSLPNKTVYPFLSSMFEVGGIRYVPVSPSERTCDAIDCAYNESAENINIGNTVTNQGISLTVKQIRPYVCYGNKYIKNVEVDLEGDISQYAFYGCTVMETVKLSNNGDIGSNAFASSKISSSLKVNNTGNIGTSAFANITGGYSANINCTGQIGSSAFSESIGLQTLEIGSNVTQIGAYAFDGCTGLETATLGEQITSLGNNVFRGCSKLQGIVVPNAVETLGTYAFYGCSSMTSAKIGTGVQTIGTYTFSGCSSLTDMQIGSNISTIDTYAFNNCKSLTTITIPQSVTNIGNNVFAGCSSLKTVTMEEQESELKLGSNGSNPLFADCPLETVYIGRNISYNTSSSYGYSPFYRNTSLTNVTITDKETEVGANEFYGCTSLKNVTIGNGVTSIGEYAFSGCSSLDKFVFGSSVSTIGKEAFSDCTAMTRLISRAITPPTCGSQALDDINKWACTLSVPEGYTSAYQQADQWKEFFFINNDVSGIENQSLKNAPYVKTRYDLGGKQLSQPQRGLNIVKMSDGTTKKMIVTK
ncbi:MAG: leucine-rich repeat protein [Prevotella sp.]|nr:leucine-rich repeat protein [Prevotella sp.]